MIFFDIFEIEIEIKICESFLISNGIFLIEIEIIKLQTKFSNVNRMV